MQRNVREILLTACLLGFPLLSQAQLLKGVLVNDSVPEDALLTYSVDGNLYANTMQEITFSPDGTFTLNPDIPVDAVDATVDFGVPGAYFGVHLQKGKTVQMTVTKKGDGNYEATFKGDNAAVNRYVNRSTIAMDMMRYWSPDPAEAKSTAEYRKLLDDEYQVTVKLLPVIKDKQLRQYYARLTEGQYTWLKIRIIMDDCYEKKMEYKDNPEYVQLTQGVDVNDPINVRSTMSLASLMAQVSAKMEGDNFDYSMELMDLTRKQVTNPVLRSMMTYVIGDSYLTYGTGSDNDQAFIDAYLAFADKDSVVAKAKVEVFLQKKTAREQTKQGTSAPDITLNTRDGKQLQLSSLLKNGKFTYIDVWATWCGPCCKEIPHLEKLVEKYKGNDKVQFISISVDSNVAAWEKKLDNDKPQWAQYILTQENDKIFSKDWGITGIPRFIMIDAEGNIFNADASRPSEDKTAEIIDAQIK